MKNYLKKHWKFYIFLIISIFCINILSLYNLNISKKMYASGEKQKDTSALKDITVGTQVEQTFTAVDDNLEMLLIDFEPYIDTENCGGQVTISVKNDQNEVLTQNTISRNYIRDNTEYMVYFEKQLDSKGRVYTINISFDDLEDYDSFYSVKITEKNKFAQNKLFLNGKELESSSIIFQDFYKSPERAYIYHGIMLALNLIVIVISVIIYNKKNIKTENIFLMIAPIICMFFLITMPTFKSHDEFYHWLKAYEVSIGHLSTPIENGVQGSYMPDAVAIINTKDWTTVTYKDLRDNLSIKLDENQQSVLNPETAAVYSFVQYLPQAIGIFMARHVTSIAVLVAYAGRLVNMFCSILLIYFAIKIIPFGKKLLLIPAMIPIAIEGFSSLSPDALTISISFLYIAYILYLAFGKKETIGIGEKIILLIMSVIIALCKIVYIPLVGLILIIPKEKFKNKSNINKIVTFVIISGIALAINLTWLAISSKYLANFREGNSTIQLLLLLKNPIQYIPLLLYTINLNGDRYLLSLFGSELGWGEFVKLYSIIPYIIAAIYSFVAITTEEIKNKFKPYQLVWITLVCIAIIGLIFTSLYIQWTNIGSTSILGVQGRYFLPILPIIMIAIGSKIKIKSLYNDENITRYVGISLLVLNIYTIAQIIIVHL